MFSGEVYQLKGYVKEPPLKVVWCNRMVFFAKLQKLK